MERGEPPKHLANQEREHRHRLPRAGGGKSNRERSRDKRRCSERRAREIGSGAERKDRWEAERSTSASAESEIENACSHGGKAGEIAGLLRLFSSHFRGAKTNRQSGIFE